MLAAVALATRRVLVGAAVPRTSYAPRPRRGTPSSRLGVPLGVKWELDALAMTYATVSSLVSFEHIVFGGNATLASPCTVAMADWAIEKYTAYRLRVHTLRRGSRTMILVRRCKRG